VIGTPADTYANFSKWLLYYFSELCKTRPWQQTQTLARPAKHGFFTTGSGMRQALVDFMEIVI
jgi:hypothetical protein